MKVRSVAVLGGGPGGLYAARLLKLRNPEARVEVHEQNQPDSTFGFGVGLATRTQRNLDAADPQTFAHILARSWSHDMSMSVGGRTVHLPQDNLMAVGRSTLLEILQQHAAECGVQLTFGRRTTASDLDADLVIAADGVNSATRTALADDLGAEVSTDHGYYLWCGTDFPLPSAVFSPVSTEAGTFVTHAYPYAADRSTFLVETDEATWRRAGFDRTTESTPADASDQQSLDYLSDAFAEQLQGHRLIGNRTRWTQFRTVTCERWHRDNLVLLGDAAHTAHYSIGSGTKLAMEDAIALDQVLAEADSIEAALDRYEQVRRPAVEHLQRTAARSMRWWHTFPGRLDLSVEQLLLSYMTRAGKVSVERFAESAPVVVRDGLRAYAGTEPPEDDLVEWILHRPFTTPRWTASTRVIDDDSRVEVVADPHTGPSDGALRLMAFTADCDDPWGPDADAVAGEARQAVASGCDGIMLTSDDDDLEAVLTMLDLAERLRSETGGVLAVSTSAGWAPHVAAGLASGRVDLVRLQADEVPA